MNLETLTSKGYTEEQANDILAMHSEGVTGLKAKNSELLGKIDGFKQTVSDQETAVEEARRLAAEKEEARLKVEGDSEGLKKHYEQQLADATAKLKAEAESKAEALRARDFSQVTGEIMGSVHETFAPAASAMLQQAVKVSYDAEGKTVVSISHGNQTFDSVADFKEFAKTDPTWSAMLSAPNTQGIGAHNGGDGQANLATKKYSDMTLSERAQMNSQ